MPASKIFASDPEQLAGLLSEHGWLLRRSEGAYRHDVRHALVELSEHLGTRVAGRGGLLEEVIQPLAAKDAHPRSLSARFGLSALPFHTELSHRPKPCRYVILGCMAAGSPAAATMLLDWRTLGFSKEELALLEEAPVLIRAGRRSFYSTILAPNRAFLRYDPGCFEAVDDRGRRALQLIHDQIAVASFDSHEWCQGDILIIDNWRVLHGRSPSVKESGRRLARILIDA